MSSTYQDFIAEAEQLARDAPDQHERLGFSLVADLWRELARNPRYRLEDLSWGPPPAPDDAEPPSGKAPGPGRSPTSASRP